MLSQKRINKELDKKFKPKFFDLTLPYHLVISQYENVPNEVSLINESNMKIEMSMVVYSEYPFKCPSISLSNHMVNVINNGYWIRHKCFLPSTKYLLWCNKMFENINLNDIYLAWLFVINKYPKMSKLWCDIPQKDSCLCCSSLTCGSNWSPGFSLYDLVGEYLLYKQFYFYTSPLMIKKIRRIFFSLFNNDRWCLSDDLIVLIFQFCHNRGNLLDNIIYDLLNMKIVK